MLTKEGAPALISLAYKLINHSSKTMFGNLDPLTGGTIAPASPDLSS
jgi:hypothetical protein